MFVALVLAAAAAAPSAPLDDAKRQQLADAVLARLAAKYVFKDKAAAAVPKLRALWTPQTLAKDPDKLALAKHLTADLRAELHDKHLAVYPVEMIDAGMLDQTFDPNAPPSAAELADARAQHFGIVKAELVDGVAVIQLDGFPSDSSETRAAYAHMLEPLAKAKAFIFDLRTNRGGDGDSVLELLSHFVPAGVKVLENTFLDRHWDSVTHKVDGVHLEKTPIFVLTSGRTASAAEEFSYDLQGLKRATLVGETTAGGANHNEFARVAGEFAFSNSVGTVRSPFTGTNWEGVGVKPDVAAPVGEALERARKLVGQAHP